MGAVSSLILGAKPGIVVWHEDSGEVRFTADQHFSPKSLRKT
jgi:hypothetical protein